MDPFSYDFFHWLWGPLRCHMADTLYSHEVKTLVFMVKSWHLLACRWVSSIPFGVVSNLRPVKTFDPWFSSEGWQHAICVTRIVHHSDVSRSFEHGVNPLWSLWLEEPILVHSAVAILPLFVVNVKCGLHISLVQPTVQVGSVNHHCVSILSPFEPWVSFCQTKTWLVNSLFKLLVLVWHSSVQVIWVQNSLRDRLWHFAPEICAECHIVSCYDSLKVNSANSLFEGIQPSIWNHVEASKCCRQYWIRIIIPVGDTIANHESFNRKFSQFLPICVVSVNTILHINFQVELVNLPCKIWNIDATITLSWYEKINVHVFWEFFIEFLQCLKCVDWRRVVAMIVGLCCGSNRKADTSWLFKVEHVSSCIPTMLINPKLSVSVGINNDWTILLECT